MTLFSSRTLGPGEASRLAAFMRRSRPGMANSNTPRLFLTGNPGHLAMLAELARDEDEREQNRRG